MANVEHSTLTGSDLHEPKGVSTANANEVYQANGSGSGSWGKVDIHKDAWSDMFGTFTSAKLTGSNQPTWTKIKDDGSGSTGVYGYAFSPTLLNELWVDFHLNHDYKVGTAFYPHIHWAPTNTDTGTVRWGIEWSYAHRTGHTGGGPTAFGTTTITYIEQAAPGVVNQHMVAEVAAPGITLTAAEPDMVILARVFRDAAHVNDTFTGSALGFFLDAHYQIDRHGTLNKAPDYYS